MNDFPYFNHWAIKIITEDGFEFSPENIEALVDTIIRFTQLTVVNSFMHNFPEHGETLVKVLSQSHLVCHTWPENNAIHIDLMTCSSGIKESEILQALDQFSIQEVDIQKLEY